MRRAATGDGLGEAVFQQVVGGDNATHGELVLHN